MQLYPALAQMGSLLAALAHRPGAFTACNTPQAVVTLYRTVVYRCARNVRLAHIQAAQVLHQHGDKGPHGGCRSILEASAERSDA